MNAPQSLDCPWFAARPRHAPIKPVEGHCDRLGCFPDLMGPDPSRCLYCGQAVEP